uniref:Uncharacterized protein n=1 Tax=Pygocentrus nattereri TaxID=42514 RepID=A0A3B4E273_PYGNA
MSTVAFYHEVVRLLLSFLLWRFIGLLIFPRVPTVRVSVPTSSSVTVEQEKPQEVYEQSGHTDPHHDLWVFDLVGVQRGEEHGVDQSAHDLGSDPAERVFAGGLGLLGEAHGHQRHEQGDHIGQHVKGVGQHRQRRGHSAHHKIVQFCSLSKKKKSFILLI